MLSEKMFEAMNDQIKHEIYSAHIYLAMSAHFMDENLPGFANWMRVQYEEEMFHAFKFYDYIFERGGKVELQTIDQPPTEFDTPLSIFEEALAHEKKVTALIHNLYAIAVEEKDYASQVFLQWFITEQVEEEDSAQELVDTLKRMGDSVNGLFMLDRQLGTRTFTPEEGEE
jgi:ferritin